MSKRAEEAALQRYAMREITHENVKLHDEFEAGYEQAEKDLALTSEDVEQIIRIAFDYHLETQSIIMTDRPFCEGVLRRFNETKK